MFLRVHFVCFCYYLAMYLSCWEALNVLLELVAQKIRISTEKWLRPHYLHWCDCVELILKHFLWSVVILLLKVVVCGTLCRNF